MKKQVKYKKIWRKCFVGCRATWLNDGVYIVTNIGAEMLMYIKIIYSWESSLIMKNKQTKRNRYFDETNKISGKCCK